MSTCKDGCPVYTHVTSRISDFVFAFVDVLDEAERSLHDALCVLSQSVQVLAISMRRVGWAVLCRCDTMCWFLRSMGSSTRVVAEVCATHGCRRSGSEVLDVCVVTKGVERILARADVRYPVQGRRHIQRRRRCLVAVTSWSSDRCGCQWGELLFSILVASHSSGCEIKWGKTRCRPQAF